MTENNGVIDNVLGWLHEGYPEGVPPKDYFPLLALLKRSLTEDQVVKAAQSILRSNDGDNPVTDSEIRDAIHRITETAPNPEEIHQVASRLASVGWPLASPVR
ncbi:hypothetical protein MMAG44476_23384 [Mycolicibacterium mageritense DSM 44476 = CIP 104973]|uniref:DUF3349 domain-containing protein n=1 Tax=Mycolicibacterium mageritense TaxID=53462 RepID=A0AAI8XP38_MYCME|nr:DUF3349 domain-containing protein [Mycolicibacterium mageritense]OKH66146.1 hypothetical protein EB73_20550 [Mycobacterium sp. SWH-M3]MCC9179761.1 DUF3349 domain-containing protein [Mycolicibacterium mageritense]TXI61626.1 MAG: DUF3349 domain-containing protein [Mycolicibacterium mageritense]CDO20806.1 putative endoIII-related endonuclease [Mycolicibacterium mageritense DSM 44476 = CIP 104973]BBX34674.1 hypothetical protein MMAGJ_39560 [Mycolicibacterium mageritense]